VAANVAHASSISLRAKWTTLKGPSTVVNAHNDDSDNRYAPKERTPVVIRWICRFVGSAMGEDG